MPTITQDPVDRFLQDAERAARDGDRDLALELTVLALDTAPGDPAVLVRAHSVRNMLLESEGSVDSPLFLDEEDLEEEGDGPMATGADRDAPSRRDHSAVLVEFPDVGDLAGDEEEPSVDSEDEADTAWSTGVEDLEATLWDAYTSPEISSPDRTRRPRSPRRRSTSDRPARKNSRAVLVLWPLLLLTLAGVAVALFQPRWLDRIETRVLYYFDPHVRSEVAFRDGDYTTARAAIDEMLSLGEHVAEAHLLAGRVALRQGEEERARRALVAAAEADENWEVSYEAGRLMVKRGWVEPAATALLGAFERGAPSNLYPAIVGALERAGDEVRARRIREHYTRMTGEPFPDTSTTTPGQPPPNDSLLPPG